MGVTTIQATITKIDKRNNRVTGEFLVDTGAGYTLNPYQMAKSLDLKPTKI